MRGPPRWRRARAAAAGTAAAAWRRVAEGIWPVLQQTAAATLAWAVARGLLGEPAPFFAPIAAVVALNTVRGERGLNALSLLTGVIAGIAVGALTLAVLGGGYLPLAAAILLALALARALGENRLVTAQAAAGAILTVALSDSGVAAERIVDALIGAGVALVFAQLLFTPEPVALLRRAEAAALADMAAGLGLLSRALARGDDRLGEEAVERLRDRDGRVADVDRVRRATTRLPRSSLAWRVRRRASEQENRHADRLGLLGGSCLALARTALGAAERGNLASPVGDIAAALRAMADGLGDRDVRRDAAHRVLVAVTDRAPDPAADDALSALRLVTTDVLVFAGLPQEQAARAVRAGTAHLRVPAPPHPPRVPLLSRLRRRRGR